MIAVHAVDSLEASAGGPSRTIPGLCRGLASLGVATRVALRRPMVRPSAEAASLAAAGIAVAADPTPLQDARLLHVHGLWSPWLHRLSVDARRRGIPVVISPRGMLEPWALAHHPWRKRLAWACFQGRDLRRAALLHATADSEAAQFRRLGLTAPVIIAPNGIEAPPWDTPAGSPGPGRIAVFLSRLHPKKGLPLLLRSWAELRPTGWSLRIAGGDEDGHRATVEALIRELGLGGCCSLVGEVDGGAKWNLLRQADLFILPTSSENFGVVVAEAMAAGLPVLTTTGAPWRCLQEHDCGWWVAPEARPFTAALTDATTSPAGRLRAMGARAMPLARTRFSWASAAGLIATAYADACAAQGAIP